MHSGGTKELLCAPQLGRLWAAQSLKKLVAFRFKQRKEMSRKESLSEQEGNPRKTRPHIR